MNTLRPKLATIFVILTQANDDSLRLVATNLVDAAGVEPAVPEAADLQSTGVTNFPTHPKTFTICKHTWVGFEPTRVMTPYIPY